MFNTERIVEFGMCDSAGILFFANIFNLTHSVYEEFFLRNFDSDYFEHDSLAIPLLNTSAEFKIPIYLHEVLKIKLTVLKIGTTSFSLKFEFFDLDNNLKAEAKTSHIFVDKNNFEKRDIPTEVLSLLKANQN